MPKRILSISYDPSLLWTRQLVLEQMGHEVISAEGFMAAKEACDKPDVVYDLVILGHSIPRQDKEQIIQYLQRHCNAPVLALLRPYETPVRAATLSVDAEPQQFVAAVEQILKTK